MATVDIPQPVNYSAMLGNIPMAQMETANSQNQLQTAAEAPLRAAQVQNVQAGTQSQLLANYMTQLKMQYAQSLMAGLSTDPNAAAAAVPMANDAGTSSAAGAAQANATQPSAATSGGASSAGASGSNPVQPGSAGAPNEDAMGLDDVGLDPAHLDAVAQHLYAVPNAMNAQEFQRYRLALGSAPILGQQALDTANAIKESSDARIQAQSVQAKQNASLSYDKASSVVNAPPGAAMARLNLVGKPVYDKLQELAADDHWTPAQLDSAARTVMSYWGQATHRYSGRDTYVGNDGVMYDKDTDQPLLGAVKQGASSNEVVMAAGRAAGAGAQMVEVPDGKGGTTQMPLWKANGYPSLDAFKQASGIPVDQTGGGAPGAGAAGSAPTAGAAPAAGGGGTAAPGATPSAGAAPYTGHPNGANIADRNWHPNIVSGAATGAAGAPGNPQLRTALSDSSYRLQLPTAPVGSTLSPDQQKERDLYAQQKNDLLDRAQTDTEGAAQSLTYLTAAKQVLQSQGKPVVGLYGPIANEITRAFGGLNSTNYQEVAKYLGNAALQNARQSYGSRMTQNEVQLQLNELSPSTHMTGPAISDLVNTMAQQAQYGIDSAHRVDAYLAAGNDARRFEDWNQHYYPRQQVVLGQTGTSTAPAQTTAPNGGVSAAGNKGRFVTSRTGQRYVSDGNNWVPVMSAGATGTY